MSNVYNAMEHTLAQKNSATIISVLPAQTQQSSMGESTVRAEVQGAQHAATETPIKIATSGTVAAFRCSDTSCGIHITRTAEFNRANSGA